ncbi:MAG: hypothetical protein KZQ83_01685 [gamma proteobacterium symbiont of Taylorina sp.]|nr:hypothetical protein [gamma proteobacterium symbiont of Taylorina sp.]
MKRFIKTILILVVTVGFVLSYGYWHSITHGSIYIDLKYKASVKEKFLSKIDVSFLDVAGKVLAKGISNKNYHYIELIQPVIGNCHDLVRSGSNKETRKLWYDCYEKQSTWMMTWIKDVSQIVVSHENCSSKKVPIIFSGSNSEWLLWWVPHPHIGGKPYSYFRASIDLEKHDCFK